ncbi:hypothetical protein EXS74_02805 [Candidatus Woesearchaeota archaeon]|nr:hypothetical protein [Candidatus Woesearchaeota archaeon]
MSRDQALTSFQRTFTYGGEYSTEAIIGAILELFPQGEQELPSSLYGVIWRPPFPEVKALEGLKQKHHALFTGMGEISLSETIKGEVERMLGEGRAERANYVRRSYPMNEQEQIRSLRELQDMDQDSFYRRCMAQAYLTTQGVGKKDLERKRHLESLIPRAKKSKVGNTLQIRELANDGEINFGKYRIFTTFEWLSEGIYMLTEF